MSYTYDYTRNANKQIIKYDDAMESLNSAKGKLIESLEKLNSIKGVQSCENLKIAINSKIGLIDSNISEIKKIKIKIKNKSKELDRQQELERQKLDSQE